MRVVMDEADVLAFDIGGANIKAADGLGWVHSETFELWRRRSELPAALARIVSQRHPRRIVATMTGEITDCYASRREGVADIVAAVMSASRAAAGPECPVGIYLVDGTIVPPQDAVRRPLAAAASNWHAIARLAAAVSTTDKAFLIDIGSTTTDIVPLVNRAPAAIGQHDVARMAAGELVYTGVERTPIATLVRSLPWRGRLHPVASELFAQSLDVWLLLGGLTEDPDSTKSGSVNTADGGPATREASQRRLARMLLADPEEVTEDEAIAMAAWCADRQSLLVARAVRRVAASCGWQPGSIVLSGHGGCLARRALARVGWDVDLVSLTDTLGPDVSRAAPAHSLALIARGQLA
jgi:(4-(4-[2-(gamma-L-glutamylamino)ethyl]phenoxymethyl)furan-2-yl)methanamine synthase